MSSETLEQVRQKVLHYVQAGRKCVNVKGGPRRSVQKAKSIKQDLDDLLAKKPHFGITQARRRIGQQHSMAESTVRKYLDLLNE